MIMKEVSVPNQKRKKRIECVSETDDEQYKKKKENVILTNWLFNFWTQSKKNDIGIKASLRICLSICLALVLTLCLSDWL